MSMIPSIIEFAEDERDDFESWLRKQGVYDQVVDFLLSGGTAVTAMRYLRQHFFYGERWKTEKPLAQLRARLRDAHKD